MSPSPLAVVILAAGQGTRMKSTLPKVLHPIAGRPMLGHVLAVAAELGAARTVAVIAPGDSATKTLAGELGAACAVQERPLGTGHAVASAEKALSGFDGTVLVLFGDLPLIMAETLRRLLARLGKEADIAALGFTPEDPSGYGRMVCEGGQVLRIVEHKDANEEERRIPLCFAGLLACNARLLFDLLRKVGNRNAQGEYYLTDIVEVAHGEGLAAAAVEGSAGEMMGVNSQVQLAAAEAVFQARLRSALMNMGVAFTAPETVFLSADTAIEPGARIGPYVVFGPGAIVRRDAEIRAFCHIEHSEIGERALVGPFARLRGGAKLDEDVHIGNFVEAKNAHLEAGVKAHHLTYMGDAHIGAKANIGAGTITCNYDGAAKHRTEIGPGAFIGSNAALVAPVKIGAGAIVGAGSVITEDVEADALALGRARQTVQADGAKRHRAKIGAKKKGR